MAHFLGSIELTSLFARSCRKLRDHILVSIAQDVDVTCLIKPEVNVIEGEQYIADERVFVIGGLAEFRRSKVDVAKQTTKIFFTLLSKRAVLDAF